MPARMAHGGLRTALAVGAVALLPALAWQTAELPSPAMAAIAPAGTGAVIPSQTHATVIGKQGITWSHTKADRISTGFAIAQPETVVEVIELVGPEAQLDSSAPAVAEEAAEAEARAAERQKFSGWLELEEGSGGLRITGFATRRDPIGRQACREQHDTIVRAFGVDPEGVRILADKPVLFQSRICAANGEVVITCHGSDAVISPRHGSKPGSMCARG